MSLGPSLLCARKLLGMIQAYTSVCEKFLDRHITDSIEEGARKWDRDDDVVQRQIVVFEFVLDVDQTGPITGRSWPAADCCTRGSS